ncbi:MAG TPA: amino acid permease [Verrucomicrobiae bacterium]|nr:amino acid permease [Verrucomicrobiae bacterium]
MEIGSHRPRNVGWARAAALLYGDWGTSKAYVIGAAFLAIEYASLPTIIAVSLLTALVGYNYVVVCKNFPDGGGVYSAARLQSRLLAVIGSLLLVANFTVTASLSAWAAMVYFKVPKEHLAISAIGVIAIIGMINVFGPKHSGSMAISLAIPMVVTVLVIAGLSAPHLTLNYLEAPHQSFTKNWTGFVGVILALSGVEAIANLTGVMKLDPNSTMENPSVRKTSRRAIIIVAAEVVIGTILLGWAVLSLSPELKPLLHERWDDMLTVLAEQYGSITFGPTFGKSLGVMVGIIVGLLLLSAVNTAVSALIGLIYLLARDGEMPRPFVRLNSHGMPVWPIVIATILPILVVLVSQKQLTLMELYAIGVVGAIAVNLGSCVINRKLKLRWYERGTMFVTFIILLAVELTLAKTKPNALFFVVCILLVGLTLRAIAQKRAGLETITVSKEIAAAVNPDALAPFQPDFSTGQSILVAARGLTPVLRFALEEARFRQGNLYVLYVKQLAVNLPGMPTGAGRPQWQDDPQASTIMYGMLELGRSSNVTVIPLFTVSDDPAATIIDLAATLGIDVLMLGAPHRTALAKLLQGDVVTEVARHLPENIQLVIHS